MNFTKWIELETFVDSYNIEKIKEKAIIESLTVVFESFNKKIEKTNSSCGNWQRIQEASGGRRRPNLARHFGNLQAPASIHRSRRLRRQREVELEDPFSGSEDAKPVDIEDIEKYMSKPSRKKDTREKNIRILVNSLKVVRNNAVRERANKIKFIQKVNAEIEKQEKDDDYISELDIDDALPALIELGYITKKQVDRIKEEEIDVQIEKFGEIIELASKEDGNDTFFSVDNEDVNQAYENIAHSMQKLYINRINNLARNNQINIGKDRIGHEYFEPEEITNELFLTVINFVSKRKWKNGKLLGWEEGNTIENFFTDENIDPLEIYKYFQASLRHTAGNLRKQGKKTLNPKRDGRSSHNLHRNKDARKKILLYDIRTSNFEFYKNYLKAIAKKDLNKSFDLRSPDAIVMIDDNTPILPQNEEDKIRLEIIKSIEAEYYITPSSRNYLSLNPEKINSTLENYVDFFLRKKENPIIHASSLQANDDDDEIDLGSYVGNDDEIKSNDPMNIRSIDQDSTLENAHLMFNFLKPYIQRAINQISREGKQTLKGNIGANEALALCIKFGFSCSLKTVKNTKGEVLPLTVTVYEEPFKNIDPEIEKYFQLKINDGSWSWDEFCKDGFNKYGLKDLKKIAELWQDYPKNVKEEEKLAHRTAGSIQEYLFGTSRPDKFNTKPGGLRKMCEIIRRMLPSLFAKNLN